MLKKNKHICAAFLSAAILIGGCAPQAQLFNVDVKNQGGKDIQFNNGKVSVFPIVPLNTRDSVRLASVAMGLAEKLEQDRDLKLGEIPVYVIPQPEFSGFNKNKSKALQEYDKNYLQELMLKSGGDVQIFVNNLNLLTYTVTKQAASYLNEAAGISVLIPYHVEMNIYSALQDSLLYSKIVKDSIYLQMLSMDNDNTKLERVISSHIPAITKKIGENLASYLTTQWETQERMLITYESEQAWVKPYELAQDFKWKEAIDCWIPLTAANNPKRSAFAAYNIAVACEMTEQFPLAMEWVKFSLKKYRFKEAEDLKTHLQNLKKVD